MLRHRRWNRDRRTAGEDFLAYWTAEQGLMMNILEGVLAKAGFARATYTYQDGFGPSGSLDPFGKLVKKGFVVEAPATSNTSVSVSHDPSFSREMANRYAASIVAAFRTVLGAHAGRLVRVQVRNQPSGAGYHSVIVLVPSERALRALYNKLGPR